MFSIFSATCFPDQMNGISQGGSGLFVAAEGSLGLPKCEGVCSASAFETYDSACISQDPCGEECEIWPVLPVNNGEPIKSCLFMYDNDNAAHTTAYPAHKILTERATNHLSISLSRWMRPSLAGTECRFFRFRVDQSVSRYFRGMLQYLCRRGHLSG